MTRKTSKNEPGPMRRVTDLALDVTIGGTALAADKAAVLAERAIDRAGDVVRRGEERLERASKQARSWASQARRRANAETSAARQRAKEPFAEPDHRHYEDRTKEELYDLAVERDIESRSSMSKPELIEALRAER